MNTPSPTPAEPIRNPNTMDLSRLVIRAYRQSSVNPNSYTGERMFLNLNELISGAVATAQASPSPQSTQLGQVQQNLTQLEGKVGSLEAITAQLQAAANPTNAQLNNSITQLQQSLNNIPKPIVVSATEPTNAATGLIWVELLSGGHAKNTWIRRGNQWWTLEPYYSNFMSGLITTSLLAQQVPISLPRGCSSIYFDSFQAVVYVASKLLSTLGFNITPQYLDWAGVAQNFPRPTPLRSTLKTRPGLSHLERHRSCDL